MAELLLEARADPSLDPETVDVSINRVMQNGVMARACAHLALVSCQSTEQQRSILRHHVQLEVCARKPVCLWSAIFCFTDGWCLQEFLKELCEQHNLAEEAVKCVAKLAEAQQQLSLELQSSSASSDQAVLSGLF